MEYKKFMALGIKPREGVLLTKYLVDIFRAREEDVVQIADLFKSHGYDLSYVPGAFFRVLTKSGNEITELSNILDKIDAMDYQITEDVSLKGIFASDLRFGCFTPDFVKNVNDAINNNLPFLYEDNTFIKELFSAEKFKAYSAKTPTDDIKPTAELDENSFAPFGNTPEEQVSENKNSAEPVQLTDPEDINVRTEIIYNLTKIMNNQDNSTFKFLITNIIANLNDVIAMDNKQYRILGTRHLVEDALQGVNITPELQNEFDEKVLQAFPDSRKEGVKR